MTAPALVARPDFGRRLFVLALLLVFAALGAQYAHKVFNHRSAFVRWSEQILALDGGANIYERFAYPNPPVMALLLRPLVKLGPEAGALTWFFLKVAMALLALAAVFRLVEAGGVPFPPWARAAAALLSLRPIVEDLSHGNINIFILFLVIGCVYAWHRRRDYAAGALLALAVCCKVTPLLLVPYFVWKRQWKVLIGWSAGMSLFLFALPGAVLGWQENTTLLRSWLNQMVVPYVVRGEVTPEHPNQSLPGTATRLLTHSASFCAYPNDVYTPTEYHNVTDIGRDGVRWLIRGCQVLFALMVMLVCRAPARDRGGWRLACEVGIILVGMLLFSERTWKHHCVTLALPFAVIVYALATVPLRRGAKIGIIAALTVACALMVSASGIFSERAADLAQVYGAYTAAFGILVGVQVALLTYPRFARRAPETEFSAPSNSDDGATSSLVAEV
jgi:hypothetical protein